VRPNSWFRSEPSMPAAVRFELSQSGASIDGQVADRRKIIQLHLTSQGCSQHRHENDAALVLEVQLHLIHLQFM